jgi:hypothetical protein
MRGSLMKDGLERIHEEAVVTHFDILPHHSLGVTDEYHEKSQSV